MELEQTVGFEVLRLAGDMRLWGRQEEKSRLLDTFDWALRGSGALVFNLRGVKRVDTMGIAFMVELLNRCIARGIIIQTVLPLGVAGQALRLIRIFGRYREFPDELAALRSGSNWPLRTAGSTGQSKPEQQENVMSTSSSAIALLVHDQSQYMEQLKKILQDLNVQLDEVPTIDAAIRRLSEGSPPEVIFLDVRLADALRLVCLALGNANSTAVIVVSPFPADSACGRALDYSAFSRLAPPLERSRVAVLLQHAVQQTMVWRQQHFAGLLSELQARVQTLSHEESARSDCSQAGIDLRLSPGMN